MTSKKQQLATLMGFIALVMTFSSGCVNSFDSTRVGDLFSGDKAPPPATHLSKKSSSERLINEMKQETLASAGGPPSFASLKKYADANHQIWNRDGQQPKTMRAQSPDNQGSNDFDGFGYGNNAKSLFGRKQNNATQTQTQSQFSRPANNSIIQTNQGSATRIGQGSGTRNQASSIGSSFQESNNNIQQSAYQYPETRLQAPPGSQFDDNTSLPSIDIGNVNELNPLVRRTAPGGNAPFPMNYADLDVYVTEAQTGRINIGGAYNSDNGIVGQFTIDERNFDITRLPRSWRDIRDGVAWRGAGQTFRLELVPGAEVQRYLVSFGEPYLFNTPISFTMSAYLFDRQYVDWDEQRLGARFSLGYRLTHDLSVSLGLRAENVKVDEPRNGNSPALNDALGDNDLYVANLSLIRDTRDSQFAATEGTYLSLSYQQAFGEYDYPRGDIEFRTYRLLSQRPDGSGRHTLSFGTKLGFSGAQTPVFENYFAGGFSTMRGFDFRGVGPIEGDIRVGGEFQWLNSLEYVFPLTADDMVKGVLFCDFGTVEEKIELNGDNFRVAPGFGFRLSMPALTGGAPLAFDFAFPIEEAFGDEKQTFSFYLGVLR